MMSKGNRLADEQRALLSYLRQLPKPFASACSPEMREFFTDTILTALKDQALSELRRKNEFPPRLIGFMDDGSMGIIDITKVFPEFGDTIQSKELTAKMHRFAAKLPAVKASVFCAEIWMLCPKEGVDEDELPDSISDHPDREEAVSFNMIHFDTKTGALMQMMAMIEVVKVLGHDVSPQSWRDTCFGRSVITDPIGDGETQFKGRFVIGNPENDK